MEYREYLVIECDSVRMLKLVTLIHKKKGYEVVSKGDFSVTLRDGWKRFCVWNLDDVKKQSIELDKEGYDLRLPVVSCRQDWDVYDDISKKGPPLYLYTFEKRSEMTPAPTGEWIEDVELEESNKKPIKSMDDLLNVKDNGSIDYEKVLDSYRPDPSDWDFEYKTIKDKGRRGLLNKMMAEMDDGWVGHSPLRIEDKTIYVVLKKPILTLNENKNESI